MKNFGRTYRLIAGTTGTYGFEIGKVDAKTGRALRCTFEVERGDSESNNSATISVYNLSPQSFSTLRWRMTIRDYRSVCPVCSV